MHFNAASTSTFGITEPWTWACNWNTTGSQAESIRACRTLFMLVLFSLQTNDEEHANALKAPKAGYLWDAQAEGKRQTTGSN